MALFDLGETVATQAAMHLCAQQDIEPVNLLARHAGGDWGSLPSTNCTAITNPADPP